MKLFLITCICKYCFCLRNLEIYSKTRQKLFTCCWCSLLTFCFLAKVHWTQLLYTENSTTSLTAYASEWLKEHFVFLLVMLPHWREAWYNANMTMKLSHCRRLPYNTVPHPRVYTAPTVTSNIPTDASKISIPMQFCGTRCLFPTKSMNIPFWKASKVGSGAMTHCVISTANHKAVKVELRCRSVMSHAPLRR